MKIHFVIPSLIGGGAERVMSTIANGLVNNHEVELITFHEGQDYELSTNINRVKLHGGNNKNQTIRSIKNLFTYYKQKEKRPDILISFLPSNNLTAIIVSKIYSIKLIISEHTNHTAPSTRKKDIIRKYFYRFADVTTVLTKFDKPYYENFKANVEIMPNPLIIPTEIKSFEERKKNILVVGSLNRYQNKGFDQILHISAPILKKNKDWNLVIAGDGEKGLKVLQKISFDLEIQKQVKFLGFVKAIDKIMQDSQIFALPSKFEGLPMGLMEALSNGMACISYNCTSGPSELITNNSNGLLITDQDSKAMQEGLELLINDFDFRLKIAKKGPESVSNYGLNAILEKWEKLILSVNQ
ncbi:Glycosyltransferase involved in cell wall bisynthesis [Maribacter aquivivus]|uniref:Glycosyltransferase involved in cell wall bisynthesis n=1 Tax=Maribacter aquivivus TaxID=228958 RepID=A0A1M6TR00_9FLAO|nr:glycosyltransferase family 4 protein [Maribacter aquivivus]SHK59401.1 Glycosyltransferase involved in cell wall bisynthesis [Maribacter aquivivus]